MQSKAGDLDFKAAEFGVVVLANAVGDVDEAALLELKSGGACGEIPTDATHALGSTGRGRGERGVLRLFLSEVQADVTLLHQTGRGYETDRARDEDGLGIAVAERLKLAQPAEEHRGDAVERQLGMNAEDVLGFAAGEVLGGVGAQAALEFRQVFRGHGEADGEGVSAETGEQVGAAFEGVEQLETIDAATGAMGDSTVGAVFNADDDGRLGGAFDDTRGEDAEDAAMPVGVVEDEDVGRVGASGMRQVRAVRGVV